MQPESSQPCSPSQAQLEEADVSSSQGNLSEEDDGGPGEKQVSNHARVNTTCCEERGKQAYPTSPCLFVSTPGKKKHYRDESESCGLESLPSRDAFLGESNGALTNSCYLCVPGSR